MGGRCVAPAAGRRRRVQRLRPVATVPGELVVTAIAAPGSSQGSRTGFVELTRGTDRRRIPFWLRVSAPALAAAQTTPLTRTGTYRGNTRGRPALVESYRYPEDPRGFGVPRVLSGPEQVFRVSLRRPVANFGVAVTGGRLDVQPRVVRAGDENRLLGEIALPYNANPYTAGFGRPMPVVGRRAPRSGRLRHRLRHAQRLERRPVHVPLLDRGHDTSATEVPVGA